MGDFHKNNNTEFTPTFMQMKTLLLIFMLSMITCTGYAQVYIPMPVDSASWRYRSFVVDEETEVIDFILYVNGSDTVVGGNTYHKVFSRTAHQFVPNSAPAPLVIDTDAAFSDIYYGAYRENDKKIYYLFPSHERLIYDFNMVPGDATPVYTGYDTVTTTDSVALADGYHKRYNTNDPNYAVIEGVGCTLGLLPEIVDGSGSTVFMCYSRGAVSYSPPAMASVPCTYIYPIGHAESAVTQVQQGATGLSVYPVPANDVLHITCTGNTTTRITITNSIGQPVWTGAVTTAQDINVSQWPKGIYIAHTNTAATIKITVQ
jgi:hypothetical protein